MILVLITGSYDSLQHLLLKNPIHGALPQLHESPAPVESVASADCDGASVYRQAGWHWHFVAGPCCVARALSHARRFFGDV